MARDQMEYDNMKSAAIAQAEKPPAIPYQLSRLLNLVDALKDGVDRIESQFEVVMTPAREGESYPESEGIDASPLTNQLWAIANRLERQTDRLMQLRERVEF